MPWMDVLIEVEGHPPVKNAVNVESIVRFGPRDSGAYIKLADGSTIQVLDSYDAILHAVLTADAKKETKDNEK